MALPGDPCSPDCGPGTTTFTLHITVSTGGTVKQGTLTLCNAGQTCDVDYAEGSTPTLTAEPATGFGFSGWSGDCSGTTCQPDMTADHSVTATFVDNVPPAVPTINGPSTNQVVQLNPGDGVFVSFSDGDPSATSFRCAIDNTSPGLATNCSSAWFAGALSTGQHTAYVWASDSVGNLSAAATRTFKVVNLPQTTLGGTPAATALTNSTSTAFSYSSPTGTSFLCTLDGTNVPCTPDIGPLTEGEHTFTAAAGISPFGDNVVYYDASPASRTFTVDSVAPTAAITSGPANGTVTSDSAVSFQFSGNDPAPGTPITFQCSLDGATFGSCPASYSGLQAGGHTFRVRASDAAGNVSAPAERSWTVIADADGDSFFTNTDCDDSSAAIHPSASDTPGNGIDEDCSGADAPAADGGATPAPTSESPGSGGPASSDQPAKNAVAAKLARSFKVSRKGALVRSLKLSGVTAGAAVALACKGKGCAFKSKSVALKNGAAALQALFKKKWLKPGAVITIKVTHSGMTGTLFTLTVKKKGQPALRAASV
jgi:hypothetical protein